MLKSMKTCEHIYNHKTLELGLRRHQRMLSKQIQICSYKLFGDIERRLSCRIDKQVLPHNRNIAAFFAAYRINHA
jgi:hypothetical protein